MEVHRVYSNGGELYCMGCFGSVHSLVDMEEVPSDYVLIELGRLMPKKEADARGFKYLARGKHQLDLDDLEIVIVRDVVLDIDDLD